MRSLLQKFCFILFWLALLPNLMAQQTITIDSQDTTLTADSYPAKGNMLYLWLPPEGGFQPAHSHIAKTLNTHGIEVWLVDLFEARFLAPVASSLEQIPATDVSILLDRAQQTGKQLVVVSSGRGIFPLLRGIHHWQQSHPSLEPLTGVILLSPQFYIETPIPGEVAELHPIVRHTNLPIFILQPKLSPWFWKLEQTVPTLQQAGSDVFVRILPEVRDRFYYRPDASHTEQQLTNNLPQLLKQAGQLLTHTPAKARPVGKPESPAESPRIGKQDRQLKPYRGNPRPPALILNDIQGKQQNLANYQGQVVLVNFWASWCPPCVHEMPSMQRLADKLGPEKFTILAVNMAEDASTINEFLQTRVSVRFPVLLDQDGAALKRWGVFAFPTSYVIDKQGNIRYALFGSVEWDNPEMLLIFSTLLQEP